jgi:hypothetical protein
VSGTATSVTGTADVLVNGQLPLLPERPKPPKDAPSVPWEYFTVVTLISTPFTALWCALVATVVESVAQDRFPPTFSGPVIAATAAVAGTASVGIGLVSLYWGGSPPLTTTASLDAEKPGPAPLGPRLGVRVPVAAPESAAASGPASAPAAAPKPGPATPTH